MIFLIIHRVAFWQVVSALLSSPHPCRPDDFTAEKSGRISALRDSASDPLKFSPLALLHQLRSVGFLVLLQV